MRDAASLLSWLLPRSDLLTGHRRVLYFSTLLTLLVFAHSRSLNAQATDGDPAAVKPMEEATPDEQALVAKAIAAIVANESAGLVREALKPVPTMSTKGAAAVLSCLFDRGAPDEMYWALSLLRNRSDLQPAFLDQTIRLIDSKEQHCQSASIDTFILVPLSRDAIFTLSKFDPAVVKRQDAVQDKLRDMLNGYLNSPQTVLAANAWLNLYGEDPRALQALEAGLDPQREIDERYDQFNLTYGSIRLWPERLTPPLAKLARSAPNLGRREQALRLLSRRQPEMAQAISREVLKTPRQDLMMVTAAFEILFPVEADSSTLFRQALERQRERVFPRTDGPPDEDFGAYSLRSSLLNSLESKLGFAGMLDFLRKEFEAASEAPSRVGLVRMIENVSSNDIEERKQAAAWMRELAADVRVGPEDRKSLESVASRLEEPPRPIRRQGRGS